MNLGRTLLCRQPRCIHQIRVLLLINISFEVLNMRKSKARLGDRKSFKSVLASNMLLFGFFLAFVVMIDMLENFSAIAKLTASVFLFLFFIFLSYLIGIKIDKNSFGRKGRAVKK